MKQHIAIERLTCLADHLEKVDEDCFNMNIWHCQTAACALGHATDIPEFQKAGLHLAGDATRGSLIPAFGGCTGYDAGKEFFQISLVDSVLLFDPFAYLVPPVDIRPTEVVRRIRNLISKLSSEDASV